MFLAPLPLTQADVMKLLNAETKNNAQSCKDFGIQINFAFLSDCT